MNSINIKELHEIFNKIKNGNESVIEELYKKYKQLISNIAFSIVKDRDIAEEICQNIFLKIIQLDKSKLPENKEISWLYTVTKNQSIEYLRKQHDISNIDIYEIENTNSEINQIIDIETYNSLIDCLNDVEKEIVSLKILTNFTYKEIGQILNIPMGTVQWKYHKAINTLRMALSNLLLFVISFALYKTYTNNTVDNKKDETINDSYNHNHTSIDSFTPSDIQGITTDSATASISSNIGNNFIQIGLFSITSLFLVLTIFFGIIYAKHQQKRIRKTSK